MTARMNLMDQKLRESQAVYASVNSLFEGGLLKQNPNGEYEVVQNPAEQEHIREQVSSKKKAAASANQSQNGKDEFVSANQSAHELNDILDDPEDYE
jgi:hypothetical protein